MTDTSYILWYFLLYTGFKYTSIFCITGKIFCNIKNYVQVKNHKHFLLFFLLFPGKNDIINLVAQPD